MFSWRFSSLDYMALTFLPGHEILYHKSWGNKSAYEGIFSRRGIPWGHSPQKQAESENEISMRKILKKE